jgi:hypothetical protein
MPIVNRILLLVQINSVLYLKRILKNNTINVTKANVNIFQYINHWIALCGELALEEAMDLS